MLAYSIRIMLAHVRIKQAAFIKNPQASNDGPELQALYALIVAQPSETSTPQAAASTSNPFVNFQQDSDDEQQDEDDEQQEETKGDEATIVYKSVQYGEHCIIGIMLKSDGSKVAANRYTRGSDGFIQCHWDEKVKTGKYGRHGRTEILGTAIPNAQLEPEGSNFILKPEQEKKTKETEEA
jgi:hypothetical protein